MIRAATINDANKIVEIYNYYISHTTISFEETLVDEKEIISRMQTIFQLNLPWLVYENEQGEIIGFAYANKWKARSAYRFTVEVSVYLKENCAEKGIGTLLYQQLFSILKQADYKNVIAIIALPNAASIALHEKFGLNKVAHFKEVGFKFNQWIDVGYWQGLLKTN